MKTMAQKPTKQRNKS